jgi:tetratricopeptide (TPR) repeat protein
MSASQIHHSIRFMILLVLTLTSAAPYCYSLDTSDEKLNEVRKGRAEFFADAYLHRGRADVERGDYLRAIRVLSAAINKGAGPEAFKWRGQAYDVSGNYEKALQDLGQYVGSNPSDPAGYVLRGDAHTFRHNFDRALEDYNKAIDLDSLSTDALMGRGLAYLGLERHEEAIKDFQTILRAEPRNPEALQNAGVAYMLSRRPAKALEFFQKAIELETVPKWKEKLEGWIAKAQQDARSPEAISGHSGEDVPVALTQEERPRETKSSEPRSSTAITAGKPAREEHTGERDGHEKVLERPLDRLLAAKKPYESRTSAAYENAGLSQKKITGDWDATYMGTRVRLSVFQQLGKRVSGALRISPVGGAEENYPFSGTFDRGDIRVSHRDGHAFHGTLGSDGRLTGILRMRNGQEISVNLGKN